VENLLKFVENLNHQVENLIIIFRILGANQTSNEPWRFLNLKITSQEFFFKFPQTHYAGEGNFN
jgi:hypothetical protein